jgi:hypothetical protein
VVKPQPDKYEPHISHTMMSKTTKQVEAQKLSGHTRVNEAGRSGDPYGSYPGRSHPRTGSVLTTKDKKSIDAIVAVNCEGLNQIYLSIQ